MKLIFAQAHAVRLVTCYEWLSVLDTLFDSSWSIYSYKPRSFKEVIKAWVLTIQSTMPALSFDYVIDEQFMLMKD